MWQLQGIKGNPRHLLSRPSLACASILKGTWWYRMAGRGPIPWSQPDGFCLFNSVGVILPACKPFPHLVILDLSAHRWLPHRSLCWYHYQQPVITAYIDLSPVHPSAGIAWQWDPWILEPCQLFPESTVPSIRPGIAKMLDKCGWVEVWMRGGSWQLCTFPQHKHSWEACLCETLNYPCIPDAPEENLKGGDCFALLIIYALFF